MKPNDPEYASGRHHHGARAAWSTWPLLPTLAILACAPTAVIGNGNPTTDGGADVHAADSGPGVGTGDARSDVAASESGSVAPKSLCPSTACNEAGWCALDPAPTGGDVSAVWMSSASDVWAATGPAVLHWNGLAWTNSDTGTTGPITGLWGTGPFDVWALSSANHANVSYPAIAHFDGTRWSRAWSGPDHKEILALQSIWGSSANDVWVAGSNGANRGAIEHYDGSHWSTTSRVQGMTFGPAVGVGGTGPTDVWVVGATNDKSNAVGTTLHWDGTSWSEIANPAPGPLNTVWGSGPSDAWAVGYDLSTGLPGTSIHWDGTTWTQVTGLASVTMGPATSCCVQPGVIGVWGSGPSDVWAVGGDGKVGHWNGTLWTVGRTASSRELTGVFGWTSSNLWAVGQAGAIEHWDGSKWSNANSDSAFQARSGTIWGASAEDVWIGDVGAVGSIRHWNGATWATVSIGTLDSARPIWGSGPDDIWGQGTESGDPVVIHWDGTSWTSAKGVPKQYLIAYISFPSGFWGTGPNDVWATNENLPVLHWDGKTWTSWKGKTLTNGSGIWGTASNDVWIVGASPGPGKDNNTIVHWDGKDWSTSLVVNEQEQTVIWGSAVNDVWTAGRDTMTNVVAIHHWDGADWSPYSTTVRTGGVSGIAGRASNDIWIWGAGADQLLHWDGKTWSPVASGVGYQLGSLWGSTGGFLATGVGGLIGGGGVICHP